MSCVRPTAEIIAAARAALDTAEASKLPDAELRCLLAYALGKRAGEARMFSREPRRITAELRRAWRLED